MKASFRWDIGLVVVLTWACLGVASGTALAQGFMVQPMKMEAIARPGQKVEHPRFGKGIVLNSTGTGAEETVTVAFDGEGVKKLQASAANLVKV